nr:peroxidase 20 [Tanacetum cinerariifolium]
MIPGTDLHCFDVHNDSYFSHLPLSYINGGILNMVVPRMPYEKGLVRVSNDRELSYMFDVKETFGRLDFYLDHLDMDLLEYLSQSISIEMDACVSKTICPLKKRYRSDFSIDKMVNWAEMEVEQQGGTSTTDKGNEKVSQDETKGVDAKTSTINIDYDSDDDSQYDSDKSVDYLSIGKEELIKLRNRMKANREAKAKGNSVSEMNEPNAENSMHADNVRGETFEEHDIYMNKLLIRLKTTNEDGITQDHFISIKKHVERYPMDELLACPLRFYARWMTKETTFQCISLDDEHTCVTNFNFGSLVNYKWIGKVFSDKIRVNPNIRLCDIADLVMKTYKRKVTPNQCTNAKKYALTEYEKNVGKHYALLRSYGKAIIYFNPGSTVKLGVTVNPDDKTYFDRFYVCFTVLADGWKAGCRKVIALDGSFLKVLIKVKYLLQLEGMEITTFTQWLRQWSMLKTKKTRVGFWSCWKKT